MNFFQKKVLFRRFSGAEIFRKAKKAETFAKQNQKIHINLGFLILLLNEVQIFASQNRKSFNFVEIKLFV
jgi:hypothetical protein